MKIDRNTQICEIPIIKIRDFFKRFRTPCSFSHQTITEHLGLTEQSGATLLSELIRLGYIEKNSKNYYVVSVKGNALANTKFVSRMNKAKADKIFGEFMKRVKKL